MALDADALIDRRRLKRQLVIWRVIGVAALLALALLAVARATGLGQRAHVARLSVGGFISEDGPRNAALEQLIQDGKAKALIVNINSPGGTTAGAEMLYVELRRVAEKMPVVATIGTLGASGGYIVALAADRVIARESSLTGSIGVLLQTAEFSGLLEKLGVGAEMLTTGKLKGEPSPLKPLSPEGRVALNELIQDSYRWFVGLVQSRRNLTADAAALVADGRVYTGRQAMEHKLIDQLGGEHEAREWLARERQVAEDLPVIDVRIHREDGPWWREVTSQAAQQAAQAIGKTLIPERLTLDGLLALWHPPDN